MVDVWKDPPEDDPPLELYSVWLPYAVYGITVDMDDDIVHAPPIARWAIGHDLSSFKTWVEKKGGTVNYARYP